MSSKNKSISRKINNIKINVALDYIELEFNKRIIEINYTNINTAISNVLSIINVSDPMLIDKIESFIIYAYIELKKLN